jgi:uncharacterized protein YndB with AHSA1/START domain
MIEFAVETEIARPRAQVFAYVTDPSKLATWQTNTVSAVAEPDGPVGPGTRFREVHRAPGGKELSSLVEVSEVEPDRVFGLHMLEGALPIDALITLEPSAAGTRMRFPAHGQPTGAMRLAEPLLPRSLRRQFAGYCQNLKRAMEDGPPSA